MKMDNHIQTNDPAKMNNPFEENAGTYDRWYDENAGMLESEISAITSLFNLAKREYGQRTKQKDIHGLEIGVGSGRFAATLGIETGIDPSPAMLEIASKRGIDVYKGVGEALPFPENCFDYTAFFTSVCFLDNPLLSFEEANRVTRENGFLLCSFLNRESAIGAFLHEHQAEDIFYKNATFYSGPELLDLLDQTGYGKFSARQTVFHGVAQRDQRHREGLGEGLYGVILAWKMQ